MVFASVFSPCLLANAVIRREQVHRVHVALQHAVRAENGAPLRHARVPVKADHVRGTVLHQLDVAAQVEFESEFDRGPSYYSIKR